MSRSRLKSKVRCRARHSSTTPRLLAKWAGRMLQHAHQLVAHLLGELLELGVGQRVQVRRRRDSRQQCGHGDDPLMVSSRRRAAPRSRAFNDRVPGRTRRAPRSRPAAGPERGQVLAAPRGPGRSARRRLSVDAQQAGIGQLAAGGVLAHALAGLLGVAFHVEQVVGDLERQPEAAAVAVETVQQLRAAAPPGASACATRAQAQTARGSAPRSCGRAGIPARRASARRARRARSQARSSTCPPTMPAAPAARASSRQQAARRRGGVALGQHLEGQRQQGVAGQDRQSPRRISCGTSAGRGAGRRRPSPAGRRG